MDENGEPPQELSIAWQCRNWNTLPENGAYFEQDKKLMTTMTTLMNIYNVLSKYRNMEGAQIHQLTESDRKILGALIKDGLWHG